MSSKRGSRRRVTLEMGDKIPVGGGEPSSGNPDKPKLSVFARLGPGAPRKYEQQDSTGAVRVNRQYDKYGESDYGNVFEHSRSHKSDDHRHSKEPRGGADDEGDHNRDSLKKDKIKSTVVVSKPAASGSETEPEDRTDEDLQRELSRLKQELSLLDQEESADDPEAKGKVIGDESDREAPLLITPHKHKKEKAGDPVKKKNKEKKKKKKKMKNLSLSEDEKQEKSKPAKKEEEEVKVSRSKTPEKVARVPERKKPSGPMIPRSVQHKALRVPRASSASSSPSSSPSRSPNHSKRSPPPRKDRGLGRDSGGRVRPSPPHHGAKDKPSDHHSLSPGRRDKSKRSRGRDSSPSQKDSRSHSLHGRSREQTSTQSSSAQHKGERHRHASPPKSDPRRSSHHVGRSRRSQSSSSAASSSSSPSPAPSPARSQANRRRHTSPSPRRGAQPSKHSSRPRERTNVSDRSQTERGGRNQSARSQSERGVSERAHHEHSEGGASERLHAERADRGSSDRAHTERGVSDRGHGDHSERHQPDRVPADRSGRGLSDKSHPERSHHVAGRAESSHGGGRSSKRDTSQPDRYKTSTSKPERASGRDRQQVGSGRERDSQGRERDVQLREREVQGRDRELQGREREVQGRERDVQGRGRESQGLDREGRDREGRKRDHPTLGSERDPPMIRESSGREHSVSSREQTEDFRRIEKRPLTEQHDPRSKEGDRRRVVEHLSPQRLAHRAVVAYDTPAQRKRPGSPVDDIQKRLLSVADDRKRPISPERLSSRDSRKLASALPRSRDQRDLDAAKPHDPRESDYPPLEYSSSRAEDLKEVHGGTRALSPTEAQRGKYSQYRDWYPSSESERYGDRYDSAAYREREEFRRDERHREHGERHDAHYSSLASLDPRDRERYERELYDRMRHPGNYSRDDEHRDSASRRDYGSYYEDQIRLRLLEESRSRGGEETRSRLLPSESSRSRLLEPDSRSRRPEEQLRARTSDDYARSGFDRYSYGVDEPDPDRVREQRRPGERDRDYEVDRAHSAHHWERGRSHEADPARVPERPREGERLRDVATPHGERPRDLDRSREVDQSRDADRSLDVDRSRDRSRDLERSHGDVGRSRDLDHPSEEVSRRERDYDVRSGSYDPRERAETSRSGREHSHDKALVPRDMARDTASQDGDENRRQRVWSREGEGRGARDEGKDDKAGDPPKERLSRRQEWEQRQERGRSWSSDKPGQDSSRKRALEESDGGAARSPGSKHRRETSPVDSVMSSSSRSLEKQREQDFKEWERKRERQEKEKERNFERISNRRLNQTQSAKFDRRSYRGETGETRDKSERTLRDREKERDKERAGERSKESEGSDRKPKDSHRDKDKPTDTADTAATDTRVTKPPTDTESSRDDARSRSSRDDTRSRSSREKDQQKTDTLLEPRTQDRWRKDDETRPEKPRDSTHADRQDETSSKSSVGLESSVPEAGNKRQRSLSADRGSSKKSRPGDWSESGAAHVDDITSRKSERQEESRSDQISPPHSHVSGVSLRGETEPAPARDTQGDTSDRRHRRDYERGRETDVGPAPRSSELVTGSRGDGGLLPHPRARELAPEQAAAPRPPPLLGDMPERDMFGNLPVAPTGKTPDVKNLSHGNVPKEQSHADTAGNNRRELPAVDDVAAADDDGQSSDSGLKYDEISDDDIDDIIGQDADSEVSATVQKKTGIVDVLDIDWSGLMKHNQVKTAGAKSGLRRFQPANIFSRIGVSLEFAGSKLHDEIQRLCQQRQDNTDESAADVEPSQEKPQSSQGADKPAPDFAFRHKMAAFHASLSNHSRERRALLEDVGPHRRALCARRDLYMRRKLCKNNSESDNVPLYLAQGSDPDQYRQSVQLLQGGEAPKPAA